MRRTEPFEQASPPARPRVLVLLATHNGSGWVRAQLLSILAQRDVDIEIAVRDDASTDGTVEIMRETLSGFEHWTLIENGTPSGSAAANFFQSIIAADVTRHDLVALADQDDLWEPCKLARAAQRLKASGAGAYSAAVRGLWPDGRSVVLSQSAKVRWADYIFEGGGQGCSFVLTRNCFERCRMVLSAHKASLSKIHYHDWAIYAVCRASGERWHFDARPCLQYRQHAANDTGARAGAAGRHKRLALIRSGWYAQQVAQIARLCGTVAADTSTGATRYLMICVLPSEALRRLVLVGFVLLHGRRRLVDRCVLAWAALRGYLP